MIGGETFIPIPNAARSLQSIQLNNPIEVSETIDVQIASSSIGINNNTFKTDKNAMHTLKQQKSHWYKHIIGY